MLHEVVSVKEALSSCVVAGGEVDLCKEEGIIWIICDSSSALLALQEGQTCIPVMASSLSPTYMADSYWCLSIASFLHSFSSCRMASKSLCELSILLAASNGLKDFERLGCGVY